MREIIFDSRAESIWRAYRPPQEATVFNSGLPLDESEFAIITKTLEKCFFLYRSLHERSS